MLQLTLLLVVSIASGAFASPVLVERANIPVPGAGVSICPRGPTYCDGSNVNRTTDNRYICGDSRLGPDSLTLFANYISLGGLCPTQWIDQYVNKTNPRYLIFPYVDEFQNTTAEQPIHGNQTLPVGLLVDRFGAETGSFLAPFGTPFAQRALYPSALNTANASFPYNYHVYNVTKAFMVLSGPIAPWFGQLGQGTQYEAYQSVASLVASNTLTPVHYNYEEVSA
ncbi:hypothetical protein NEOLEDRAFT_1170260 [Neolentinus lepideus HHB14362 ss-1]|uniref:TNT domain-containing protein n=1 Tax=Neolentinus lepideus HHB14362 ss-1 TaxID=1314782 RepID=A0A165RRZ8_9AGAM|nr:hypothetical protein NEOLEDRAFT_1170260 [Neolentinus lepideus HHB14362 ss-1]